jgi:integrase
MPIKRDKALSPRKVKTAGPGLYCDGGGLYLQVTKTKALKQGKVGKQADDGQRYNRSWIFRYSVRSGGTAKLRDMGLGPLRTLSLSDARDLARELRQKRLQGIDPLEEKRAQRAADAAANAKVLTFDEAWQKFVGDREQHWKGSESRRQWAQSLRDYASPVIGKMAVRDIETRHITQILDPLWPSKPTTASRLRGRIEQVLDWCKTRGHRSGENPARWKGHLSQVYASPRKVSKSLRRRIGKARHHPALPYREVATFIAQLRTLSSIGARALEFLILTVPRASELTHATWGEFDLGGKIWSIPSHRMKVEDEHEEPHRIPLSDRALAIIQEMAAIRQNNFVFPGEREGKPLKAGTLLTTAQSINPNITTHGFRSTFRDFAAEQTSFPREIAEKALAHAVGDETERAYQRGDLLEKRRKLMEAWAAYCERKPSAKDNVTAIRSKRAAS